KPPCQNRRAMMTTKRRRSDSMASVPAFASDRRRDVAPEEAAVGRGRVADAQIGRLDTFAAAGVALHGGFQDAGREQGSLDRVGRPTRFEELLDVGRQAVEELGAGR